MSNSFAEDPGMQLKVFGFFFFCFTCIHVKVVIANLNNV